MRPFVFVLFILFIYSFQNNPTNITKNNKDKDIYRFVIFSKSDWEYLSKYTIKGKDAISLVYEKCNVDVIQKVQYESKSQKLSELQKEKLRSVLKKYE
ncbi:MAG: hypothetical protein Fur0023_13180 [Bacteroidia bacterium]